jgi:uncharacterized membrane protein YciS (DUF1049 family)
MFRWIVLIACLLAALLGLAVGVMNPEPVSLRLFDFQLSLALGSLVVIVFIAGLALGLLLFLLLFHLPSRWSRRGRRVKSGSAGLPDQHA